MANEPLFKRLCDPTTISIGWHLAHGDSRDDFATDSLGYADYALLKAERFQFIIEQLKHDRYRVSRVLEIDIPKSGLSVRPGNVLPIEEATILHAIIYLIAPRLDQHLRDGVYSYRLAKDWQRKVKKADSLFANSSVDNIPFLKSRTIRAISLEEPWYVAWPEFDAAGARAFKQQGFSHLTKTDITAYFENIDLQTLELMIRKYLPNESTIIAILMRILNSWTRRTSTGVPIGRGIPQGNNVSSFLGNIYLMPLDEALTAFARKHKAIWFRYVDDIKVFTRNYEDARNAVFLINQELRKLHLNLQGSKTDILSGLKLENELFDRELDLINDAIQNLEKEHSINTKGTIPIAAKKISQRFSRSLPQSVAKLTGRESRLFRRCLSLYGLAKRSALRQSAIAALKQIPDLRVLRSCFGYLKRIDSTYHDRIGEDLIDLIRRNELPFGYQVATAIEAISYLAPKDPRTIASQIRRIGLVGRRHWYVRQKAVECITRLPYLENSAEKLADKALRDEHPWVRRAGAMLMVRGSISWVREKCEELVYHADVEVARIGLYWKRHLDNRELSEQALANLFTGDHSDGSFMRKLPIVYLLRCHKDQVIGQRLLKVLAIYSKSRNSVVRWHCEEVGNGLKKWVESTKRKR